MSLQYQIEAIVLHSRDFGERDVLLTLLSKERGKLTIVCKGVKKTSSRLRAAAQLFGCARFFLYEGKSLPAATQAESLVVHAELAADLKKFVAASYWSELTIQLLPEREMNFHVYRLLFKALHLLNENFTWPLFYAYIVKLLILTGYEPELMQCVACGANPSEVKYLSPEEGGIMCEACARRYYKVQEGTYQSLRLFKQASMEAVCKLKLNTQVRKELHRFLTEYVMNRTERRLNAADFFPVLE